MEKVDEAKDALQAHIDEQPATADGDEQPATADDASLLPLPTPPTEQRQATVQQQQAWRPKHAIGIPFLTRTPPDCTQRCPACPHPFLAIKSRRPLAVTHAPPRTLPHFLSPMPCAASMHLLAAHA